MAVLLGDGGHHWVVGGKVGSMTTDYARGYRDGIEAAAKACLDEVEERPSLLAAQAIGRTYKRIAALPPPSAPSEGTECPECGGDGLVELDENRDWTCEFCGGTGRVGGDK